MAGAALHTRTHAVHAELPEMELMLEHGPVGDGCREPSGGLWGATLLLLNKHACIHCETSSLRLCLGTEAPVMTLNSMDFSFLSIKTYAMCAMSQAVYA